MHEDRDLILVVTAALYQNLQTVLLALVGLQTVQDYPFPLPDSFLMETLSFQSDLDIISKLAILPQLFSFSDEQLSWMKVKFAELACEYFKRHYT